MANYKKKLNLGIFGFGHMGQAIFRLLLKQYKINSKLNFFIYSLGVKQVKRATCLSNLEELIKKCDIIFICVKPQDFYALNKTYKAPGKIIVSIMAGVKVAKIKKIFPSSKIIRAMPNLPLLVGQGVIGWRAEKTINKKELKLIKNIFSAFGYSLIVKTEDELDKITALTGSGPAYVFLFFNALIKSAVALGFSPKIAKPMITKLILGSLEYVDERNENLVDLINQVKSRGGTTEAALKKIDLNKFYEQWRNAIYQAYLKAKELSSYEK